MNRRLLRIKAMQRIYAFQQCRASDYELAADYVKEVFHAELMLLGAEHKARIMKEQATVLEAFAHTHRAYEYTLEVRATLAEEKLQKILEEALRKYRNLVQADQARLRTDMLKEIETLQYKYLRILNDITCLAEYTREKLDEKQFNRVNAPVKERIAAALLFDNKAIARLKNDSFFRRELERYKVSINWEQLWEWYRLLLKDEEFMALFNQEKANDFDHHKEVVLYLLRDFLFKNEAVADSFEEDDLNWVENKPILRSLLSKTIKSLSEQTDDLVEILQVSKNWEEDKEFFEGIFKKSIQEEFEYEPLIEKKSEKWAKDRITQVDRILLNMALTEMLNYPSIPVKVTLNEFIEISKLYSTPKSWQYLNGMLDALSKQLTEEGKIRKSGRGLLDNK